MKSLLALGPVIIVMVMAPAGAYGHGLSLDAIPSVNIDGTKSTITVEMSAGSDSKRITISAASDATGQNAGGVTFLVGVYHGGEIILDDYFLAVDGIVAIDAVAGTGGVEVSGQRHGTPEAWRATDGQPVTVTGPVFQDAGLYTFEIQVYGADGQPQGGVHRADLSITETKEFVQDDGVKFGTRSYFDAITGLEYDSQAGTVSIEMPFDWSQNTISHIPVVHVEVHFPKDFAEYTSPSYAGTVNGVDLFRSSVTIDDYTEPDERIVHFVLLASHLQVIKNQLADELPANMVFGLAMSDENQFPMTAYTAGEEFYVDLSWEPPEIMPDQDVNFIFTIRDGATGSPLRQSSYDFVIIQNGKEIHRVHDTATVGGSFAKYTFSEAQTGPTIVRFEDIRGTGAETEFGLVIVPEFGGVALLVLLVTMAFVVIGCRSSAFRGIRI